MKKDNPIFDPLGIEVFAIDETFESVFNGLKGVICACILRSHNGQTA